MGGGCEKLVVYSEMEQQQNKWRKEIFPMV